MVAKRCPNFLNQIASKAIYIQIINCFPEDFIKQKLN